MYLIDYTTSMAKITKETNTSLYEKHADSMNKVTKALQDEKTPLYAQNAMMLTFSYEVAFVLPYAEGVAMMAALEHATHVETDYSGKITGFDKESIMNKLQTKLVSEQFLRERKLEILLEKDSDTSE